MRFAALLFVGLALRAFGSGVTLAWEPSPDTNVVGYFLYLGHSPVGGNLGSALLKFNARTNLSWSANLPGGTWYAVVTAYSTNNSDGARIESTPSNEVMFYIPQPPGLEVKVDNPFVPPIITLSSNPVARVTAFLQLSLDLSGTNWSEGVPLLHYDVNDGTNAFYRARLEIAPSPR